MVTAYKTHGFLWFRPQRDRWRLSDHAIVLSRPRRVGAVLGVWYEPLDSPRLMSDFAALGVLTDQEGGPSCATESAPVRRAALRFVRDYGALETDARGVFPDEVWLSPLLEAAGLFAMWRDIAARYAPGDDALERTGAEWSLLIDTVNDHTRGVRVALRDDGSEGLTCESLSSAIWYQLLRAIAGGATWKTCRGCGRLFVPDKRTDQEYHSASCRNQANVRNSRERSRHAQDK